MSVPLTTSNPFTNLGLTEVSRYLSIAPKAPSQLSTSLINPTGGPKPSSVSVGPNVLLKGSPSPVDTPLPAGNSGPVLPAGVQKSDLPATSILPPGANLSTPNLKPLFTQAQPLTISNPNSTVSASPNITSGNGGLFGVSWTTIGIVLIVIVLMVIAIKHRG